MASCNLTRNIDISCDAIRKVGGAKAKLWRVSDMIGFSYTVNVNGYITALSFATYQGLVYLTARNKQHVATDVPQTTEAGTVFFQHNVTVRAFPDTPEDDEALQDWQAAEGAIIIQTMSNDFFLYGAENGMRAQSDGGGNLEDYSFSMTLLGEERGRPLRILATDAATTLALLESYEI
jgi:hypothetical protein